MTRTIFGRVAFSAAVALALGFGASQAVAATSGGTQGLYCSDEGDCYNTCLREFPGREVLSICTFDNRCYCYY